MSTTTSTITTTSTTPTTSSLSGGWSAFLAFLLWGVVPIYWKALKAVGPLEILGHRIIWSALLLFLVLALKGRLGLVKAAFLSSRQVGLLSLSTLFIAANWFIYIWAVNHDFVLETSLGYFLNPLLNIVLGMLFFRERLRTWQWPAVFLAAIGVLNLTLQLGTFPWIALSLALTFALYGLIRKMSQVDSMSGLWIETLMLLIPAVTYLFSLKSHNSLSFLQLGFKTDLLLIGAGLVTTLPLLFFGNAAKQLPLSTLGFFQYIAPSCQFLIAVFLFQERFTHHHLVTFSLIWTALLIYSFEKFMNIDRSH